MGEVETEQQNNTPYQNRPIFKSTIFLNTIIELTQTIAKLGIPAKNVLLCVS